MVGVAQLSVTDQRRSVRHSVAYATIGEHLRKGEIALQVCNLSANGLMIEGASDLARGDRVMIRLPEIGRIEGCCVWTSGDRAGFQFERIVRPAELDAMLAVMQPRLRRAG